MASNRSRRFRSITSRIAEIDKQVGSIDRTMQTVVDGLGSDSVSADSILSKSVGPEALQYQSVTADKIAPSVFESASSGVNRVPAPLNSEEYWNQAIYGNITAFSDAYFANKENKNVSVSSEGITFSPESDSAFIIASAEVKDGGLVVIVTRSAHNYEVGDYITVSNLGSPMDGEWVITGVPNSTSLTYDIDQYYEETTVVESPGAYLDMGGSTDTPGYIQTIIKKSYIDGVVTLVLRDEADIDQNTYDSHGYEVGYVVDVFGLGSPYDGTHRITSIPDNQSNAIQYVPSNNSVASFVPRIALTSAWGNGENIAYDSSSIHGLASNDQVEITGFTTNTAYNKTLGTVSGVYGGGTSFTIDSTYLPAVDEPESGGTYYCYYATVKAEADSVLFLTGKNPVPASRNIVIGWVSDNPIKFYAVCWTATNRDFPYFIEVDANKTENIYKLSGTNKYMFEVPEEVEHYAVYAEVLANNTEVLLKECYVFESVGDLSKSVEKIPVISVAALASDANQITAYTASTHSFEVGDRVVLSDMGNVSEKLNKEFDIISVSADRYSFTVSAPVTKFSVTTVSGSNSLSTTQSTVDEFGTSYNLDVSGLIYVGQPYISSNTTAIANGTVTSITGTTLLSDTKTGLVATLSSGSNTVTLTTGNTTTDFYVGQQLTKTAGTGAFGNTGVVYVTSISNSTAFTVDRNHATSGSTTFKASLVSKTQQSFTVSSTAGATDTNGVELTFYLPTTDAGANVAVNGTVIGGYKKHQSSFVNPSGLIIDSGFGQGVNLTEDQTDNYLSIYNADSESVASISNTGEGTFAANVTGENFNTDGSVNSASVTTTTADISTANINSLNLSTVQDSSNSTYLVGNFANASYNNGISYTDSYLNRLSRGVIYKSYWDIPTSTIPTGMAFYGIAAGNFQLEEGREYEIFASTGSIRYTPNQNTAMELLLSDTPIRVTDNIALARMSVVMFNNATTGITNEFFQDLRGYFQSVPATGSTFVGGSTANITSASISSWSRATSSNTITVTLSNSNPLSIYLKTGDYVSTNNMGNTSYHGTWPITVINSTSFSYTAYNVASAFSNSGTTGDITLMEPQMNNLAATFSRNGNGLGVSTPTTITYAIYNYFVPGQRVTVTGASPNTFNVVDAYVTAANANSFTVSSSNVGSNTTTASSTMTVSWTANQLQINKTVLPAKKDIYWILRLRSGSSTTANTAFAVNGNPAGVVTVTDMGQSKALTYAARQQDWTTGFPPALVSGGTVSGGTGTTTTTYTNTITLTSQASAYYDNYGKGDSGTSDPYVNQNSLYQGNPGTASGTKKSIVVFPAISFPAGTTENRTVTKVEVYLRNRHSYNAGGLTTKIGVHGYSATNYSNLPSSSIPTTNVGSYAPTSTSFTKGQGKWVTLSSSVNSFALSSGLRGVVISLTDNSPITYDSTLSNYGYFDGYLQSDPPKLRITYTYTVTT